jgi:hypothetical protein
MAPVSKESAHAHCVAAHNNSDEIEYRTCVDLAMDALIDRRLTRRVVDRLQAFGDRGMPEQREHIARLIERLS